MTDKKKKVSISVDADLWNEAGEKIPNRSAFIEEQLELYLSNDLSEEKEVLELIDEKNAELSILEGKLCKLREARLSKVKDVNIFDAPMVSINRIHGKLGEIGKNQIKRFAKSNDVPYDALLEYVVGCGLNVVNYCEVGK